MKSESETKSIWNESLHYDVIHSAMENEGETKSIRVLIKQYQILQNVRYQSTVKPALVTTSIKQ
jgi:hypothetical protein